MIDIYPYIWEWLAIILRWLHVITAIAWVGSSFYFIALDLGLLKEEQSADGVHGEAWQVHGGGFYHIQKYMIAPERLPKHVTWFKWESYATWLSGFALLVVSYYFSADLFLVDPDILPLETWLAVTLSIASLGLGWIIYDLLCKSALNKNHTFLMIILYGVLVAVAYGYTNIFSGKAALLHIGAFAATIMTANVFLIIIPFQKIVVQDLKDKKRPDPKYGIIAKQRSTHNNYLVLPVIFLMLSNHYPLIFATSYNWLIASIVFLMGVTIRHFFNKKHARKGNLWWLWGVTAILFFCIIFLSTFTQKLDTPIKEDVSLKGNALKVTQYDDFNEIRNIVTGRCSMCHAQEPFYDDSIIWAPQAIFLESDKDIIQNAKAIYIHSGLTRSMPPANVSFMEHEERLRIIQWYEKRKNLF